MPFDFPNTPSIGDLFQDSSSGAVYRWNGYAWVGGVTGVGFFMPLQGVSDGSNAPAGQIGEVISSVVTAPGVTLSNGVAANVTSISLTAGDWDVQGEVWSAIGTGGATNAIGSISTVSATLAIIGIGGSRTQTNCLLSAGSAAVLSLRPARINVTATTLCYLVALTSFSTGVCTAYGNIMARRVR